MEVTLVLNYFVYDPECRMKCEVGVYQDVNEALLYVAQLKSQGYDISSCHYGIYKGNLHTNHWHKGPVVDISGDYELPVIKLPFKEELKVAWRQWKSLFHY